MRRIVVSAIVVLALGQAIVAEGQWSRERPEPGQLTSGASETGIAMRPIPGQPGIWQPAIVHMLFDRLYYAERQASGTWTITPFEPDGNPSEIDSPIALAFTSTGDPRIAYPSAALGPQGGLLIYRAREGGLWSRHEAGGFALKPVTLALDPINGAAHIAFVRKDTPTAKPRIAYKYSTDGVLWPLTYVPMQTDQTVGLPSLALDPAGIAYIAYAVNDPIAPPFNFLKLASSNGDVPTPTFTTEVVASEPQPVGNLKLEWDPITAGPRIAFTEVGPDPFKTYLLMRSKVLDDWGSNEVVDSASVDINDMDFHIDEQGTQHLVYEALPGPLGFREVRYARRTFGAPGFVIEVVRASEDESRYPDGCSIAVDPATLTPSVAYSFNQGNEGMLTRAERGSTVDVAPPVGYRETRTVVRPSPFRGVGRPTIMLSVSREVLVEGGVFDLKGRRVRAVGPVWCHAGLNEIALDLDGLRDGVYLVGIRSETAAWGAKVVVMK